MSEHIYKDYIPANARVVVDYTKPKEQRVSFSYPTSWDYKKAVWKMAFPTITNFWIILHIRLIILSSVIAIPLYALYQFATGKLTLASTISNSPPPSPVSINILFFKVISALIFAIFYFYGIPALFNYFISKDKKKLADVVPKAGYYTALMTGQLKKQTYTSNDLTEDNKIVIPQFNNVFLDFDCSGDFEKYLARIEIMEYPFTFKRIHLGLITFKKRESKQQNNEWFFRAVFHFSHKPVEGELNVIYD